ncbi:MAG TPA: TetR/AcrR family transcriptional regulator [Thermodesulfobacteriota bacterium]
MGTVERRERERAATRAKILDAARELFVTEGYDAVTMRRIADRIEYTAAALYRHFPDRQALLDAVVEADFRTFADALRARVGDEADPIERIRLAGLAYVDFAVRYPSHYRLLFMTPRPERPGSASGAAGRDAYLILRRAVEAALAAGRFRPDLTDPGVVTHALWAAVHGVAALHVARQGGSVPEAEPRSVAAVVCDAVLDGLARRRPR